MIAIIGSGNVATHLERAFTDFSQYEACLINPHTLEGIPDDVEFIIIAVSDDAISEVVSKLPETEAIILHTSGSVPLSVLSDKSRNNEGKVNKTGVFYPLQTFSKNLDLNYKEIPVFVEGSDKKTERRIKELAHAFSDKVYTADSEKRRKLHLASVFVCNFTNALAGVGKDILKETGIEFEVLLPLMNQTINKLYNLSPAEAQTGPAARGDKKVMEKHHEMLENRPDLQHIYDILSQLIRDQRNEK